MPTVGAPVRERRGDMLLDIAPVGEDGSEPAD
jgi:hypothetical protein